MLGWRQAAAQHLLHRPVVIRRCKAHASRRMARERGRPAVYAAAPPVCGRPSWLIGPNAACTWLRSPIPKPAP